MVQTTARGAASGEDRAITILDVAREAEVSKSTVSRVWNGSPHVATVDRGARARHRLAHGLPCQRRRAGASTTRSFLVGLLVPAISNDVFSRIAEVLEEDLRHESVGLVIVSSGWDAGGERVALESLRDRRVDALVVSLVNDRDAELAQLLAAVASPIVLLDREIPGRPCRRGPDRPARRDP